MPNKPSVLQTGEIELDTTRADRTASVLKAMAGAAPVVGSLVAELITVTIPDQKQDRIVAFLKVLADKVKFIEEDALRDKMKNEQFTDLLEDAIRAASRSTSPERREYLASLLKNSLTMDEVDHIGKKELLTILDALNDAEIVLLKYYSLHPDDRDAFRDKNYWVLIADIRATPTNRALRKRYDDTLRESGVVKTDSPTGIFSSFKATDLGRLFLRYIDLGSGTEKTKSPKAAAS